MHTTHSKINPADKQRVYYEDTHNIQHAHEITFKKTSVIASVKT